MSVAVMSRIRLVGLNTERSKILNALTSQKQFEARSTSPLCDLATAVDEARMNELLSKQAKISFALDFLNSNHAESSKLISKHLAVFDEAKINYPDVKTLTPLKKGSRVLISESDFNDVGAKEFELISVCDELDKLSKKLVDLKSEQSRISNDIRAYQPFAAYDGKLSELGAHKYVTVIAAHNPSVNAKIDFGDMNVAYTFEGSHGTFITVICLNEDAAAVNVRLTERGFSICTLRDDCTAAEKIQSLRKEFDDITRQTLIARLNAMKFDDKYNELGVLYDVYGLSLERAEAENRFLRTEGAFVLDGWVPECNKDAVRHEVESVANVYIEFLRPEEGDSPPTLAQNPKVVQPFEDVTNMYSAPKYREFDPNIVMSVFFFIFFGIMIGDAGYGMILTAVGLFLGLRGKLEKGTKSLLLLVGICGISATVWGVVFGGYFAIDFGDNQVALWFNPLENPINLLIVSIVCGCVQLVVAYIIKGMKLVSAGKPFSAIFDAGFVILLFVALACLGLNLLTQIDALFTAAIAIAITGVVGIFFTAGREKKGIFGKLLGGFSGLYGLVNLFSDVLSYCRIFGLSLASCAIGFAFNTLGAMFFDLGVIGYIIGIIILIPLHIFNIGIGVLGAYVHNARLQFLEFYGKFYEGEGRLFTPLGERTKYIRFN